MSRVVRSKGALVLVPPLALLCALAGCASGTASSSGVIEVVVAENFWGNIARQLGGEKVEVRSIITNPETDPHDYEPRAQDARSVASAAYVIFNGVGYDPWMPKLVAANADKKQITLDVGKLVGVPEGGNPHRWYSPADVGTVIAQITADYKRVDPANAAYFDELRAAFEGTGLKHYNELITDIRLKYAGTPVGASESIVAPLADALGVKLLTPASFLNAISEGTDPTAQDKATVDAQIKDHQIKIYVFNSQNSTPDVQAQVKLAQSENIPVTSVTETLSPATSSFQDWQSGQLERIEEALAKVKAA